MPFLALLAGVFTILAAVLDWDWFMNDRKARPFVNMFGRDGARAFYVFLGLVICVLSFGGALRSVGF